LLVNDNDSHRSEVKTGQDRQGSRSMDPALLIFFLWNNRNYSMSMQLIYYIIYCHHNDLLINFFWFMICNHETGYSCLLPAPRASQLGEQYGKMESKQPNKYRSFRDKIKSWLPLYLPHKTMSCPESVLSQNDQTPNKLQSLKFMGFSLCMHNACIPDLRNCSRQSEKL